VDPLRQYPLLPGSLPLNTARATVLAELCTHITTSQLHNPLSDCAREQFKPSKDIASLLDCVEKNWKVLDFKFFVGNVKSGLGFRLFWLRLPGPEPQPLEGIFSLYFFRK